MSRLRKYQKLIFLSFWLLLSSIGHTQEVRFLVDESGSMEKSDPNKLRIPALKLITHLLPNENKAGIWTFSTKTKNIVPFGQVTGRWRQEVRKKLEHLETGGAHSNLVKALLKVSQDWFYEPVVDERIIILLTDAKVDVSSDPQKNQQSRQQLLNEVIPKLKKHKITVYTIGLSKKIDSHLLDLIANQTNGTFQMVSNPEKLQDTFYQIFNEAVNRNEIPIVNNRFVISKDTKSFTLILDKKRFPINKLYDPENDIFPYDKARVISSPSLRFITIENPQAGEWKLDGSLSGIDRVFIVSDLSLVIRRFKQNLFAGEKVVSFAYLAKDGQRITNQKLLSKTKVDIDFSDNKIIYMDPPTEYEANFRKSFYLPKDKHGDVLIKFMAVNDQFKIMKSQLLRIEPFPFKITFRKKNKYLMQIHVVGVSSSLSSSNLSATIRYKINDRKVKFTKYSNNKYFAKYPIECTKGSYTVFLSLTGTKINGAPYQLKTLQYDLKCRKPQQLDSVIEPFEEADLIQKKSNIKTIIKYIERKGSSFLLMPALITIMTLLILSAVAILLARFIKRRKLTKLINEFMLEEKQQAREEEKEAGSQADSEKGKDHD